MKRFTRDAIKLALYIMILGFVVGIPITIVLKMLVKLYGVL